MTDFRGRPLPEPGEPAGYAALIELYGLAIPSPPHLSAIARRHHPESTPAWAMYSPRHRPAHTLADQLTFALKWEGADLSVLSALFETIGDDAVRDFVLETPTGIYARRVWFFYEWLTGRQLDLPDPGKVRATPAIDPGFQFAAKIGDVSARHRVIDNMPGTRAFCPLVRRTAALAMREADSMGQRARAIVADTPPDLMMRAASFLLLKDSKHSFAIEKEQPSGSKATRWAQAIGQAGARPLSIAEFERLQRVVIDERFVRLGLRDEGGFVGDHDRHTQEPLPEHISARHEDLRALLEGIVAFGERAITREMDPVVVAAAMSFGFVYIHPFVDGNGRLHRWLIQHVLAVTKYGAPGVVLPVSAAMYRDQVAYGDVLRSYSSELLPWIDWKATPRNNIEVLNDTAPFYRFFDATAHTEYLYDCLAQTVDKDLPEEIAYLRAFDRFSRSVQGFLDLTSKQVQLLRGFLEDQNGRLSKRAREREFSFLTDEEASEIEQLYQDAFGQDR